MNIYVDRKNDEVRVINETIEGENSMEEQAVQTKDLIEIMRVNQCVCVCVVWVGGGGGGGVAIHVKERVL